MKTQSIGSSSLRSTRLAYGCWRLVSTMNPKEVTPDREAEGRRAVLAAFEAGYTLFDHADIYCAGVCERVFGEAMKGVSGWRDRVVIATKCGIIFGGNPNPDSPHRYDFSPEHIVKSCEQSLKRLGIDTIDLYQLHRPDLLMDPPAVAAAFSQLRQQGKVKEFGVSNFSPSFVSALQGACDFPLVVNQVEVHLARLDCFHDGTLDQCLEKKMTPLAWSPLGGGVLGDESTVDADNPRRTSLLKLQQTLDEVAMRYAASRSHIALAWLLKHPSGIIPIVGSINPERIADATRADDINLSREDWYRLLVAARGVALP